MSLGFGFFFRESFWKLLAFVRKFSTSLAELLRHKEQEQEEAPQSTQTPTGVGTAVLGSCLHSWPYKSFPAAGL